MFTVAEINSRNELGHLLNQRELLGEAVEVGTHRGAYAKILLDKWRGQRLYCVDPWWDGPDYLGQTQYLEGSDGDREKDFHECLQVLAPHKHRVEILRTVSSEAVTHFRHDSLDLVYLDGNHAKVYVEQDLYLWWPKVRSGGLLAGHDIICPWDTKAGDNWGGGIQEAVWDFARREEVDIYLIPEPGGLPWSFYLLHP